MTDPPGRTVAARLRRRCQWMRLLRGVGMAGSKNPPDLQWGWIHNWSGRRRLSAGRRNGAKRIERTCREKEVGNESGSRQAAAVHGWPVEAHATNGTMRAVDMGEDECQRSLCNTPPPQVSVTPFRLLGHDGNQHKIEGR